MLYTLTSENIAKWVGSKMLVHISTCLDRFATSSNWPGVFGDASWHYWWAEIWTVVRCSTLVLGSIDASGPWMQECMYPSLLWCHPTNPPSVYRVSWLRAKAHFSRWSEEICLVEFEMQWTVNWFRWKKEQWNKRLSDLEDEERPPGLDCYCYKQMVLWGSLADQAQTKFSTVKTRLTLTDFLLHQVRSDFQSSGVFV